MQTKYEEVLVCVAGATPQIITETIYALANKNPPVYIDKIYIITTKTGKEKIKDTLIDRGILNALLNEYSLPPIDFSEESIIVIENEGKEIEDIRNASENEATADTIIKFIRELTLNPKLRLHCSIAGGRKTMSFYLGSALQLFGRIQDKLYHVLVSPEFESNPDFFYKPKIDRNIMYLSPNGKRLKINTSEAKIELAELPFIRLAEKLNLHGKTFKELISESQSEIDMATTQPQIEINIKDRLINIASEKIHLDPIMLTLYATLLKQKISCKYDRTCSGCSECYVSLIALTEEPLLSIMADFYSEIYDFDNYEKAQFKKKLSDRYSIDVLRSYISKINRTIRGTLKVAQFIPYCLVTSIRKYAATVYGIPVDRRKIILK
ncbi:CRISPR-associated protein Csx14 [Thermodesulfovibrio aggregans]|uniref:CRISPR-associated protein Csx14 n=1 Tax=Thermodesulfovibrio aggregans TaxID=86166 RepID=A0A0U9HWW7_9BACT|nr:CRISPR-associated ring nuclease Csm6 [Thermodesulfovibrio aggregans]GAQ95569.1 CRISPR-associated protein Csx14 [Thermodesulfovibrio aggregans]